MCSRWSKCSLQVIEKVKGRFTLPHKTRKVRKKRWTPTTINGVLFGRKKMRSLRSYWRRSKYMLAIWKNVPHLQWQSLPLVLVAIHWFEPSRWAQWHMKVNSFVLDTTNNLIELFTTMTDINKWDSILYVHPCFHNMSNYLLLVINNFLLARSIEMDHVKPSLVHDFICIQSIEMIFLINSKRSFLMPNKRNAKTKSRRLGIASSRRHFSNKCIKYNFYIFWRTPFSRTIPSNYEP
jgi:hypothetical protein